MTVDMSKVFSLQELNGDDAEETEELRALARKAQDFISSFDWCTGLKDIRVGLAVAAVVGVFLVKVAPASESADEQLWVVVGDIPPAYLVTDEASTPTEALVIYVSLMRQWVTAVRAGRPVTDLIPVDAEPTEAAASALSSRIQFLEERIVPEFESRPRPA